MKKRIFILVFALALAVLLCACGGVEDLEKLKNIELPPLPTVGLYDEEEPALSQSVEPTPGAYLGDLGEEPEPSIIVRIENTTMEQYDPADGTQLILTFGYDTPTVYMEGNEAAAAAVNESIARINETYYTGDSYGEEVEGSMPSGFLGMLEAAEDNFYVNYHSGGDLPLEYSSTRTVRVERLDSKMICLVFNDYSYTGGAHGIYTDRAYLYSSETGARLHLEDLCRDPDGMKAYLRDSMFNSLEPDLREYYSNFLYEKDLSQALEDLIRDGSFYFNDQGLVIFSDVYELASYADGIVTFVFPYDQLYGYLDEAWFPEERTEEGELEVISLDAVPDGGLWIVDRLALDEVGGEWCLVARGTLYDVTICNAYYSDFTSSFFAHGQLWKAAQLCNSAVQIKSDIPDGLPNLMIRYTTSDGQVHTKLLSQSGEDGHPMLVDDTVEAVG